MKQHQLFQKPMLLVSFLLITSFCFSQVTEQWVKRYNGPGNSVDRATKVVVDGSGNVYVTGTSQGTGSGDDYATIKYSAAGTQVWVKRYNGPGNGADNPATVAVDASGNVYVTGYSLGSGGTNDYATIKYDAAGNVLWVKRYNGPGNGDDRASSLAVDAAGNVYVGGGLQISDASEYATIKYDAAGNELWVKRYAGEGVSSLAVDASGNVYVTGSSSDDYTTIKYNTAGNVLWVKQYNSAESRLDRAYELAIDAAGNVYVTGGSETDCDDCNFVQDFATVKYNAAGNELWVKRYDGSYDDFATDLAVDAAGNVYVIGFSEVAATSMDYTTVKYDASGNALWVRRFNSPGNGSDDAYDVAVDGSGNVYVTGDYGYYSDAATGPDYGTIKYDAAGNERWVKIYNGPANSFDGAISLAVDASDNVYVTGRSNGSGSSLDFATIKYSQTQSAQAVSSFTLINADNEQAIRELKDGDTLNLATLPSLNLNIRANTSSATVGSVLFSLGGTTSRIHTENIAPYALFADNNNGNYYGWTPANGNYTLTATPYSAAKGAGQQGTPLTIHFYVIYQRAVSFTLVNADTDTDITLLRSGAVIDLSKLTTKNLNIRANTNPAKVGSVIFNLSGSQTRKHTENIAPYALFADNNTGDYYGWTPQVGNYLLTATPYEQVKGTGNKGVAYTIAFSVTEGTSNAVTATAAVSPQQTSIVSVFQAAKGGLIATPNPVANQAMIRFSVPRSGYTSLDLCDVNGVAVARLYQAQAETGKVYSVPFERKHLPSGVYILRTITGKQVQSYKLVLTQ